MSSQPAANVLDVSIDLEDQSPGPPNQNGSSVQTRGASAMRMGDNGVYPKCSEGSNVRWVSTHGSATVLINKKQAVGGGMRTVHDGGSVGFILAADASVLLGGPSITMDEAARQRAIETLDMALEGIDRWNARDRELFRRWFGDDSVEARRDIRDKLLKTRSKLERVEFVHEGVYEDFLGIDDKKTYAHVSKADDANTMYLHPPFRESEVSPLDEPDDLNTRPQTLIHEGTHFADSADLEDQYYGYENAQNLATSDPEAARNNPDNVGYYADNYAHDKDYEERYGRKPYYENY